MVSRRLITGGIVAAVIAVLYAVNMVYFSTKPDLFTVAAGQGDETNGTLFTATCARLMHTMLNGPGGWVSNDIFLSPTWMLDNKPNFQLGVLEVVRYSSRILRDNLSRQRTTDKIDPDCDQAFTRFSNDPHRWIIPSPEGKYSEGIEALEGFASRLGYGTASFYPRSDNLIQLLEQYASLLGGVNSRLLNASRALPPESSAEPGGHTAAGEKVPWTEIDDNFYYAQGVGYGLYHMLQAVRVDFAGVLRDKNADVIMQDIIASLEESYFEPLIVTNGGKAGVLANHSSNLRVFLDDARQKINSLVTMLDQG